MKEQAELGRLMDDVNETAQRIKTRLTNLDAAIKEKAASDSDANARIKRTLHASSQKKVPLPWRTLLPAFKNRFLRAVHGLHDALPNCANKVSRRPSITWPPALHQPRRGEWPARQSRASRYKDMYRERVERQYKTVNPHATPQVRYTYHARLAPAPRRPCCSAHPAAPQQVSEVLEGDGSAIFATMSVGALAGD